MPKQEEFWFVASGYGANTHEPFVEIEFRGERVQLSPEDALSIARLLFEGAEASLSDAFLTEWLLDKLDVDERSVGALLADFRSWRGERRDKMEGR